MSEQDALPGTGPAAEADIRVHMTDQAPIAMHVDEQVPQLVEHAIRRGEGLMASNGALSVSTGKRTGRSPKDRFIMEDPLSSPKIDWGAINRPFPADAFEALWNRAFQHLIRRGEVFVSHLRAGADPVHGLTLKLITEYAWHTLFARQLFVRERGLHPVDSEWTILCVPSYITDPVRDGAQSDGTLIIDLLDRRILLCGLQYAGEMKKAVFSVLNYLLPEKGVLPMHCAANVGDNGDVALFFGLSGTGKTTLSADPARFLIGDDEHGWDDRGIFNFEGGCYAKCINLTPEREPVIWNAIRFGAVMENVVLDPFYRTPLYDDETHTQNTRVAYPREFIEKRMPENRAGHPQALIFLTCDLYGVLPPVAILSREQAAYHFLSGYTALVGSTEVDLHQDVKPTFSACFGAPFFPRRPREYADLLMQKIDRHRSAVYLVNTGWTGGAYGRDGRRFSIATTRALIHAILRGELRDCETEHLPGLNLTIPRVVHGMEADVLNPRDTWHDKTDYERQAGKLVELFIHNFDRFDVSQSIRAAGPSIA